MTIRRFVVFGTAVLCVSTTVKTFFDFNDFVNLSKFTKKNLQRDEFYRYQNQAHIFLTEFGWNSLNESIRNQTARTVYSKLFTESIMKHPRYLNRSIYENSTESSPNIVFLDVETCRETNWPNYGKNFANWDVPATPKSRAYCKYFKEVINSPALSHPRSRLVILDCRGLPFRNGHPHGGYYCFRGLGTNDQNSQKKKAAIAWRKLMIGFVSLDSTYFIPNTQIPFGLPPLAVRPSSLNFTQIKLLYNCDAAKERQWFFFFRGRQASVVRRHLEFLHDPENKIYSLTSSTHLRKVTINANTSTMINDDYKDMLANSIFAAAPRGDNLFSYRFAEALSAGAIPVIYADNWVLPFTDAVVNWTDIAVIIPEIKVNETISILRNISMDQICKMQQRAYEVFHNYMQSHDGLLNGILETIYHETKELSI